MKSVMQIKQLHKWKLSYAQAIKLQKKLANRVKFTAIRTTPRFIAGLDCALSKNSQKIIAAVIVLKLPDFELIEAKTDDRKLTFPYIPGLLSFREAPVCIAAVKKLKAVPDVFLIDGQGIAHPRRLGLASHLGLFFNKPTIGCAKSRLMGSYEEPKPDKGAYNLLFDENTGDRQTIGAVLRTRKDVKPVFVSVGNMCTLDDAIRITLECAVKYRLPEPTRLAHQFVSKLRLK